MTVLSSDPRRLGLRLIRGTVILMALFLAAVPTVLGEDATRTFNIPSGAAEDTLGLFAQQAATQFVFSADKVKGVRTNALKGGYAPREALNRLVAGTPLRVVQDAGTGALTVDRGPADQISGESDSAKKKTP